MMSEKIRNKGLEWLWGIINNRTFVCLSLLALSVVILLQSPLAPYANGCVENDSSIFITIARSMLDGNVLYKDVADHKGPIVFLMDALGIVLTNGQLVGIWFLEVLSLFVTGLFAYCTARLLFDRIVSLLSAFLSLLFLIPVLMGGNLTEEWALPYIAIAMYVFSKNIILKRDFSFAQLFVLSFTFVMAFLLKATYVCVWCAFGLVIIVNLLKERRYKIILTYLSLIIFFILLVMSPFVVYFMYHDALKDAYYWMIEFNTLYSSTTGVLSNLCYSMQILLGIRFLPIVVVAVCFVMLINGDYKKSKMLFGGCFLAFVLTAYTCAIGNRYEHYNIVFSPLLVWVYGYLIHLLSLDTPLKRISLMILIIAGGSTLMLKKMINMNYNVLDADRTVHKVVSLVQKHSKSDDTLIGSGLVDRAIYVYSDRKCVNKYLSNAYSPDITDEVLSKEPHLIVHFAHVPLDESVLQIYSLAESYGQYEIYVKNKTNNPKE